MKRAAAGAQCKTPGSNSSVGGGWGRPDLRKIHFVTTKKYYQLISLLNVFKINIYLVIFNPKYDIN